MKINFIINLLNSKTLQIFDITNINLSLPLEIESMTMEVISSRLDNSKQPFKFDIMAYLKHQRIQNEILTIVSSALGLDSNKDIPDGVYHFEYTINGIIKNNLSFLIYQNVASKVKQMLIETNYKVEVDNNEMKYISDSVDIKYDIEQVRYAKILLDVLEENTQIPNEVVVNDTLDKLERILKIIKE